MHNMKKLLIPVLFINLCFFTLAVSAAENIAAAQQVIEKSSSQINQTLKLPEYQSNFNKSTGFVDGIVSQFVDMPRVSILVLGKNIRQATPAQRQQFMKEFKTLLVRTYTKAFLEYKEWSLSFSPSNDNKDDGKTIVKTLVNQPGQKPVNISYRMVMTKDGSWKVYDILIEGISLVTNYRSSFNQEIAQSGSIDSVIKTLIDKNNKSEAAGQS